MEQLQLPKLVKRALFFAYKWDRSPRRDLRDYWSNWCGVVGLKRSPKGLGKSRKPSKKRISPFDGGRGCSSSCNFLEFPRHVMEPEWSRNSSSFDVEPGPVYYPGTEISGYMPRRGDFAHVSGYGNLANDASSPIVTFVLLPGT